jgi:hypothetical protein
MLSDLSYVLDNLYIHKGFNEELEGSAFAV